MSSMMMASSICALIFDYTSEEALLNRPDFSYRTLSSLYLLIARCLASSEQDTKEDMDLSEIVSSGDFVYCMLASLDGLLGTPASERLSRTDFDPLDLDYL
ncbi:hypothetical protein CR513_40040, partial [Mucuna pruriens]